MRSGPRTGGRGTGGRRRPPDLVVLVPSGPPGRRLRRAFRPLGAEVVGQGAASAAARVAGSAARAVAVVRVDPGVADGPVRVERTHPVLAAALQGFGLDVAPGGTEPTAAPDPPWLTDAVGGRPLARIVVPRAARTGAGGLLARALTTWSAAVAARTVVLAGPRSFCAGVERAVEIVERALDRFGAPVFVRRQIVHNAHVVSRLEGRGAVFVRELDEVPAGSTVVLSAHGVAPAVREQGAERGLHVIDATCPLVAKVHAEARRFHRQGRRVVLIGHVGHDEVEGTIGEVPDTVVVASVADVARLELDEDMPVALINQTTLAPADLADVAAAVRARFASVAEPSASDICYATQNRQDAVRDVAREADLVLVVGSANSSNSNRLVEVARRCGCPAHLVEDESGLDPAWLAGARRIAVTAGASTPEELVERVVGALATLGPVEVREHRVTQENVHFQLPQEVR